MAASAITWLPDRSNYKGEKRKTRGTDYDPFHDDLADDDSIYDGDVDVYDPEPQEPDFGPEDTDSGSDDGDGEPPEEPAGPPADPPGYAGKLPRLEPASAPAGSPPNAPGAALPSPLTPTIDVVIEDVLLRLRSIPVDETMTAQGFARIFLRPIQDAFRHASVYVFVIDKRQFVPLAKAPTQKKRSHATITVDHYTMQDGPLPTAEVWAGVMANKEARMSVFSYLGRYILKHVKIYKGKTLILDGCFQGDGDLRPMMVTCQHDGSRKIAYLESDRHGEADMMVPIYCLRFKCNTIVVDSYDGDFIPILLALLKRYGNKADPNARFTGEILLHTYTQAGKEKSWCVVDMRKALACVEETLKKTYPLLQSPVGYFMSVCALMGCDYVDSLPGISWTTALKGIAMSNKVKDIYLLAEANPLLYKRVLYGIKLMYVGKSDKYYQLVWETAKEPRKFFSTMCEYVYPRGPGERWSMFASEERFKAHTRRFLFTMEYWTRGYTHLIPDNVGVDETGASVWGWVRTFYVDDSGTGVVERADRVTTEPGAWGDEE